MRGRVGGWVGGMGQHGNFSLVWNGLVCFGLSGIATRTIRPELHIGESKIWPPFQQRYRIIIYAGLPSSGHNARLRSHGLHSHGSAILQGRNKPVNTSVFRCCRVLYVFLFCIPSIILAIFLPPVPSLL